MKCTACGSEEHNMILVAEDSRLHTTNEKFNLFQCRQCGLVYVNPRPAREEIGKFYPRDYYGKQGLMGNVLAKLLQYTKIQKIVSFKNKGRILDVGCGDGGFLLHFKERGWEVYGVDISEASYKLASEKIRWGIFNCELEDCHFPDRYFDVITLNHVLEHMLDPSGELREVHRILKDDGILLISTPNIDSLQFKICKERWLGLDLPRHIYHYSPGTITAILEKSGFNIVGIAYPLLHSPLDLFHSLRAKRLGTCTKLFKAIFYLPLLIVSIFIKLFPTWRGTMEVTAQRS